MRRTGHDARIVAAVGFVALGSVVALGALGSSGAAGELARHERDSGATAAAAAESAAATAAPTSVGSGQGFLTRSAKGGWPPLRVSGFGLVPMSLVLPDPGRAVTRTFVAVRGTVRGRPEEVRVILETSDHRVLAATVVATHNVHGGIRPDRAPIVDVRLALPSPRPVGDRLWVRIGAYDALGTLLGTMRRPVDIGPLSDGGRG